MHDSSMQLYDIYMQWHVPFWQTRLCGIIAAVFIVLFFCWIVWCLFRWQKNRKRSLSYYERAQLALNQLAKSDEINLVCPEQFYTQLIVILKQYLSMHYSYDFTSKTDDECAQILPDICVDESICQCVEQILKGSLTVRFAQDKRLVALLQHDLQKAQHIITTTYVVKRQSA